MALSLGRAAPAAAQARVSATLNTCLIAVVVLAVLCRCLLAVAEEGGKSLMATNDATKTAAYENYPNNALGRRSAPLAIASGVTLPMPVETGGFNEMGLEVRMSGAADADMAVNVYPVASDGQTGGVPLTPVSSTGPKFSTPNVFYFGTYDVSTQTRVVVSVKNNGAGAGNGIVDIQLN
jgi:hypothetical protein